MAAMGTWEGQCETHRRLWKSGVNVPEGSCHGTVSAGASGKEWKWRLPYSLYNTLLLFVGVSNKAKQREAKSGNRGSRVGAGHTHTQTEAFQQLWKVTWSQGCGGGGSE